jgi:hypothetical protein
LSPDRDPDNAPSVEKSRKVAPPVSPIREEEDDSVDELSLVADITESARKAEGLLGSARKTPTPAAASAAATLARSSRINEGASSIRRREKSTSSGPVTPAMLVGNQKRIMARTPQVEEDADESPDELTPKPTDAPIVRSKTKSPSVPTVLQDVDELSPEHNKDSRPSPDSVVVGRSKEQQTRPAHISTPNIPRKRGRPRKVVAEEQEEDIIQSTPAQSKPRRISNNTIDGEEANHESVAEEDDMARSTIPKGKPKSTEARAPNVSQKRKRPRRVIAEEEDDVESIPAASKPRRITSKTLDVGQAEGSANDQEEEQDRVDELSPDMARTKEKSRAVRKGTQDTQGASDTRRAEDEDTHHTTVPDTSAHKDPSTHRQTSDAVPSSDEPPRKRQKRGPTQAIQVMRLEGSGTRALTVVDTTRHVLEQWTTHRIEKMTNKLGRLSSADAVHARKLRQHRNVVLAYKEEIDDVLLGLQDANDTGTHRAAKYKRIYRENKQLRNEVHELEKDRLNVALENDEAVADFIRKKQEHMTRDQLSTSLYDIQSAIRDGKEKARREGRDDEGPELPLKMVLDDVARNFGANGLLARVKNFNGFLGKAAAIFEGKA